MSVVETTTSSRPALPTVLMALPRRLGVRTPRLYHSRPHASTPPPRHRWNNGPRARRGRLLRSPSDQRGAGAGRPRPPRPRPRAPHGRRPVRIRPGPLRRPGCRGYARPAGGRRGLDARPRSLRGAWRARPLPGKSPQLSGRGARAQCGPRGGDGATHRDGRPAASRARRARRRLPAAVPRRPLRGLPQPGSAAAHRRQGGRAARGAPRADPRRPAGLHRLGRAARRRRRRAPAPARVDGRHHAADARRLSRAAGRGRLRRRRRRGPRRRVARRAARTARDVPRDARGHGGAPGRGALRRIRPALRVLRRPGRGRQARRRPLQRNGDVELAVSGASTSKSAALVALPSIVVTVIGPVVAVPGTMARTWLALPESTVPAAEPKRTAVASLRALPLMVTVVPASPAVGVKSVTVGSTRKFPPDVTVPASLVMVIRPVVAPIGTTARSDVVTLAFGRLVSAGTPLNFTMLVSVRLGPPRRTGVPA